jgi:hypothetical protein
MISGEYGGPVAVFVPRHTYGLKERLIRSPGCLGELLARDALLESLTDEAA